MRIRTNYNKHTKFAIGQNSYINICIQSILHTYKRRHNALAFEMSVQNERAREKKTECVQTE